MNKPHRQRSLGCRADASGPIPRIGRWVIERRDEMLTCAFSTVLHGALVLILALIVVPGELKKEFFALITSRVAEDEAVEPEPVEIIRQPERIDEVNVVDDTPQLNPGRLAAISSPADFDISDKDIAVELDDPDTPVIDVRLGKYGGRSKAGRQALLRQHGGSEASEAAVAAGLAWLASIQRHDGSWNFPEIGRGSDVVSWNESRGTLHSPIGATSMALLCFLGAGHTHKQDGRYRTTVQQGLEFLQANVTELRHGADLRGDSGGRGNSGMYVQGLATIVVCEASGMVSDDRKLRSFAQAAVNFVAWAQDPKGGGWRYEPQQAGDTSVAGWQIMALTSARAAKIRVSRNNLRRAGRFLDSVAADGGAQYGYTGQQKNRATTTAVGLLCRMYLGWGRRNRALRRGVEWLSQRGPSPDNMYYNYYATQVLHHWSGAKWNRWNKVMREQLIRSQRRTGPGKGSWDPVGRRHEPGGRIYQTALSVMTLEVYYRHLPLYRREAVAVEF